MCVCLPPLPRKKNEKYHTGKRWRTFGKTGPGHKPGKAKDKKDDVYNFTDNTAAFTKNGWIEFTRPDDIQPTEVNGQTHYWLRSRIVEGNYGHPGKYELIMWISYLSKFRLYINIFVVNNYHIIPMNNFIAIMVS